MEIQQLRHMLAAANASSYAQAAKICFTSRQNIAHSVKVIENELDVTIFARDGNKMMPTPKGKQIIHHANEIITKVDNMHVMFENPGSEVLLLNLAVSTNLFAGIPSSAVALLEEYSSERAVRISELDCGECYKYVCSKKVDAALIMCMQREFPGCSVLEIASSITYALTSSTSPLAELMHLSINDLKDKKLLLMSEPDFQYAPLFTQLDSFGFNRADASVIPSTSTMVHMLKRSQAVAIVSEKFAANPPEATVAIPIFEPQVNWHFYMLYQKHSLSQSMLKRLTQDIRNLFESDGGCGAVKQSF